MKDKNWVGQPASRPIREATRDLVEAVMLDAWPRNAAIIDFGLDSQKHYEALYYPIRNGDISAQALDEALGHGAKLTALVREAPSNPHKDVEFYTSWDGMAGRPRPEGALSEAAKLNGVMERLLKSSGPKPQEKGSEGREQ
jgi:hypothetical protein